MQEELQFVKEILNNSLNQRLTYQYEKILVVKIFDGKTKVEFFDGIQVRIFEPKNYSQLIFTLQELFNIIEIVEFVQKNDKDFAGVPIVATREYINICPTEVSNKIEKFLFDKGYKPNKGRFERIVMNKIFLNEI